jgi:hypothetical protein
MVRRLDLLNIELVYKLIGITPTSFLTTVGDSPKFITDGIIIHEFFDVRNLAIDIIENRLPNFGESQSD